MARVRGRKQASMRQLSLAFPNRWGGARKGAGRKAGVRPKTPHRSRPQHCARHPLHVTLRSGFRQLRSQRVVAALQGALRRSARKAPERFRVVQFSVQSDHLHLLVEAQDRAAVSKGMQGLAISMARRVNRLLGRRGPLWADRFHARALASPRAVRNAMVYILANFRKHARRVFPAGIDRFSSAAWFDGWLLTPSQRRRLEHIAGLAPPLRDARQAHSQHVSRPLREEHAAHLARPEVSTRTVLVASDSASASCVVPARTWLARTGWQRHGLISLSEQPVRPA